MAKKVVLSIGGSLLNPGKPDRKYAHQIKSIMEMWEGKAGLVVGGGKPARIAAGKVRKKGGSEFDADMAAIKVTHQNAKFLKSVLGKDAGFAYTFDEAGRVLKKKKYVLMGGTIPGITTDADSALLAEKIGAHRIVNLSNVNGIYNSNPKKNPNARKFSKMEHAQLVKLAAKSDTRKAGENFVFDLLACKLIARSKIEAHFVDGRNIEDVKKAIFGERHSGTVVK